MNNSWEERLRAVVEALGVGSFLHTQRCFGVGGQLGWSRGVAVSVEPGAQGLAQWLEVGNARKPGGERRAGRGGGGHHWGWGSGEASGREQCVCGVAVGASWGTSRGAGCAARAKGPGSKVALQALLLSFAFGKSQGQGWGVS